MKSARLVLLALVLTLLPNFAAAEDVNVLSGRWGVGYQGMSLQDSYYLNGVSVRGWFNDRFGLQGSAFYYNSQQSRNEDKTLMLGTVKGMYSPLVSKHSRFYLGLEVGGGDIDSDHDSGGDSGVLLVRPSFGAEFGFSEIPDLGFNFDVGYTYSSYDRKSESRRDRNVDGVSVSFGAAYYF